MVIEAYNPDKHNLLDTQRIKPGDAVINTKYGWDVPALHHANTNGFPHAQRAWDQEAVEFVIPSALQSTEYTPTA